MATIAYHVLTANPRQPTTTAAMYRDIAHAVYKRGESAMDSYEFPSWAIIVFLVNIVVFLPLLLLVSSTPFSLKMLAFPARDQHETSTKNRLANSSL